MYLPKILSDLMSSYNLDDNKLSELSGVNPATIKKLRLGQSSNPTLESLAPLAKVFDISVSQLIGEVSISETDTNSIKIAMLSWKELSFKPRESLLITSYISGSDNNVKDQQCFATQILSDKYQSPFLNNTIIIINPSKKPQDGDFVLCLFDKDLEICKIITHFGQKHVVSMVSSMQNPIKIDCIDNFLGTIIETRNVLENRLIKEQLQHPLNLANFLKIQINKLLLN